VGTIVEALATIAIATGVVAAITGITWLAVAILKSFDVDVD
jgi:hypothetical protein